MGKEVTILLVEDDEVDVMAVKRAFKTCKIANPLVVAGDGIEALEVMRGENGYQPLDKPHLILLDLNMPRMDGLQFLEEIRNDTQLCKSIVFVLTTSTDDRDKSAAYSKCIAGYITKSDFDQSFLNAVEMLESFWKIIEFP